MLQLVLGVAGSGKTSWLLGQIAQRANAAQPSVLLVPDQFSQSAESLVYHQLGAHKSSYVEVVSFRTLAERIFKLCGGPSTPVLDDAARVVYVRRALDVVADEMKTYARQRASTAFCVGCADVLNEFKTAGATPAAVREIGRTAGLDKLVELSLLFEAYNGILEQSAMDPQDKLLHAAARADCGYFAGKACFIDNFDGFTAPEYTLIAAMLQNAQALYVSLCADGLAEIDGGLGLFSPVRKTAARLINHATKAEVSAKAPVVLQPWRGENGAPPAPAAVNLLLALGEEPENPGEIKTGGITLTNAPDEWEELRLVAAGMRRLAKTGVSYSRMAVICRDVAAYEAPVRRAFAMYGIPYFTDAVSSLEYTAPVAFLRAALAVLRRGISGETVLALVKTDLCGYAPESIAALENYVFTWSPKAGEWRGEFTGNPDGLMQDMTREGEAQLALAEALRADVVPRLEKFVDTCRGASAADVTRQLYLLLQAFAAGQHNEAMAAALTKRGFLQEADECLRSWDAAMGLLDTMHALLGGEIVGAQGYDELFLLLVRSTDFGSVPQTLECATFTAADRMRLDGVDHCFVVGLCEGEFPMQVGYSGLLSHTDRDLLVEGGIEMPGSFENRILLEDMVLYRALTAAKTGLYLSWPSRRVGQARSMSAALTVLAEVFNPPALTVDGADMAPTSGAAYDLLGAQYRDNSPAAATLHRALQLAGEDTRLAKLGAAGPKAGVKVADRAALHRIVGQEITLSATRAERYFACRFSYYLERVLRVQPRRKAEFSPMESGTFVHYLLEQVMREAGEDFKDKTDNELCQMANRYADAFLQENLPEQTRRGERLLADIREATSKLLCYLRDGARQSEFVTDALELDISEGGDVEPLVLQLPTGETVKVVGKIDRVDVLKTADGKTYLCIVDYKTGSKKFDLADVYCGLNMQMMLYMYTLLQNGQQRYPNAQVAGVMYLTGDPAPASGRREAAGQKVYGMDGILLSNPDILTALDKNGEGLYLPVKHKGGKARASKKLADADKLGRVANHVEGLMAEMAKGVYDGSFDAVPRVKKNGDSPCRWCPYRAACLHEDGRNEALVEAPEDAFVPPAKAVPVAAEGEPPLSLFDMILEEGGDAP